MTTTILGAIMDFIINNLFYILGLAALLLTGACMTYDYKMGYLSNPFKK